MEKKDAEKILCDKKKCNLLIHIGSTPESNDYINFKISIAQADVNFDNYGITIRDFNAENTEVAIPYIKLTDIKMSRYNATVLTYRYKTVYIEIEF